MVISEIELYDLLSQQLGAEKAKVVVRYVEAKVDSRLEEKKSDFILERDKDKLLTKADALMIFASKEDLAKVEGKLGTKIAEMRSEIIKWMFIFWVGQLVSFIAIARFVFHQ
jgi:hypothetical protein